MSPRKSRGWQVWVEPSGDGWRCRWKGKYGTGQAIFPYKDDANELAISKRRDFQRMDAGLPALIRPQSALTVSGWAKTFLENSKREGNRQRGRNRTYTNFHKPAVESFAAMHGPLALAAIKEQHVKDWKYAVESKSGPTTASMLFRAVTTFLNAAVKAGELDKSPARYVPKPAEGPGGRPLRDEEIAVLNEVAEEALYRTGQFSMNTGLRLEEVVEFDWSNVWELPGGKLMGRIPADKRKTRKKVSEDAIFPINAAAKAVMGYRRTSGRVFPWSPTTIQHQVLRARKNGKLAEDVTFHCFRHTFASRYLNGTGHMEDLLKSHLWNDPRSLLRYVRVDPLVFHKRSGGLKVPCLPPKSKKPPTRTLSRRLA